MLNVRDIYQAIRAAEDPRSELDNPPLTLRRHGASFSKK
jgi:hypothetical protein